MSLPGNKDLLEYARKLRKEMTKEERRLWYYCLRGRQEKFYRQRIIGNYIVDFYCAKLKLAIELDGSQHFEAEGLAYDARRTAYLNSLGIEVIRFANNDVSQRFDSVCEAIEYKIREIEARNSACNHPCGASRHLP